jgi:hypothetical protein
MVRNSKIGAPKGGLNKLKYQCKVCDVHPNGCDLSKHYQTKADLELLTEMRMCADSHSMFALLFQNYQIRTSSEVTNI